MFMSRTEAIFLASGTFGFIVLGGWAVATYAQGQIIFTSVLAPLTLLWIVITSFLFQKKKRKQMRNVWKGGGGPTFRNSHSRRPPPRDLLFLSRPP